MIVFGIILASMFTYMVFGQLLVRMDTKAAIARNTVFETRRRAVAWNSYGDPTRYEDISPGGIDRKAITAELWTDQFLWPIMLWVRLTQNTANKSMDKVDPAIMRRLTAEREQMQREADEAAEREHRAAEKALEQAIQLQAITNKARKLGIKA